MRQQEAETKPRDLAQPCQLTASLSDAVAALTSDRSLDDILGYILAEAMCLLGCVGPAIYLLGDDG